MKLSTPKSEERKLPSQTDLFMFIRMTAFGLKLNRNYPGLGDEIIKLYEERFKQKLV